MSVDEGEDLAGGDEAVAEEEAVAEAQAAAEEQGALVRVTQSVAGLDFAFLEGTIVDVRNGDVPSELARHSEPFAGIPEKPPLIFDAAAFADRRRRRLERPTEPARLTQADVCRRFQWTAEQFATARLCGFPEGDHHHTSRAGTWFEGRYDTWREDRITEWADRVRALKVC